MHAPHFALLALAAIFGSEFLAQVAGMDVGWLAPVVNAGGFGVVCWVLRWFMTDVKRELIDLRREISGMRQELNEANTAHFYSVMVHKAANEEMRGDAERRIAEAKERLKDGAP